MSPHDAAIARLEVQLSSLADIVRRQESAIDRMIGQIDAMERKLDQSAGGVAVLKWLGFGSLGSAIAVSAAVYAWLKSAH